MKEREKEKNKIWKENGNKYVGIWTEGLWTMKYLTNFC